MRWEMAILCDDGCQFVGEIGFDECDALKQPLDAQGLTGK